EAPREEQASEADDDDPGRERAEPGEVDDAGGDRGEARVVGGDRQQRVGVEQMMRSQDVLGVPEMDELVTEAERGRRAQELDEVQGQAEQQDQLESLAAFGAGPQHRDRGRNEDEQ